MSFSVRTCILFVKAKFWPAVSAKEGLMMGTKSSKEYQKINKNIKKPSLTPINYLKDMKWVVASKNVNELMDMLA